MRYYWGLAIGHLYAHPKTPSQTLSNRYSTHQGTGTDPEVESDNNSFEDVFTDPIPVHDIDEELLLERRDENIWDDPGEEYLDRDFEQDYAYDELFADVQ